MLEPSSTWETKQGAANAEAAQPPTKGNASRHPGRAAATAASSQPGYDIYSPGTPTQAVHMRRLALPGLAVARVSNADLAGGGALARLADTGAFVVTALRTPDRATPAR